MLDQHQYTFGVAELNQALRMLRSHGVRPKIDRARMSGQIWYDCYMGCGIEIALYGDKGFCDLYNAASAYRGSKPHDHPHVQLDVFRFYFQPTKSYSDPELTDWSPGMFSLVGQNGALTRWEADGHFFTTIIKE